MRSSKKRSAKESISAVEELRAYAKARQEENSQKNEPQDPWLAEPMSFLDFCRHDEQMAFPELSDKQKEFCTAGLASDPKETFNRTARLYDIVVGLCGKGSGKDLCASLLACYFVYLLLNLRKAHGFLTGRHIEGEPIDILLVAPRGRTTEKVTFEKIKQRVLNWKWLRDKFRVRLSGREITAKDRDEDGNTVEIGSNSIVFPGNVRIFALNSSQESAEGFNVLCFICTEFAAFVNTDDRPNADKIYRTLYTSANTRFPGRFLGILISFPRYDGDAMMQMIEEAKTNKRIFPMVSPSWEFNPTLKESDFAAEFNSDNPKVVADAMAKYACKPGAKATRYISHPDRILSCISDRPMIADLEPFEEILNGRKMGRLRIAKFNLHRQPDSRKYVARVDLGEVRDRAALCLAHLEGSRVVVDLLGHWVPNELEKRIVDVDDPANIIIELKKKFCNLVFCTFDQWNCLVGDTRISLLDGREVPIRDLEKESNFWVYSYDHKTGNIVPGKGHSARKTGTQADVFSVKLDNGEEIKATADHLFMLRDGSYRKLSDLIPGDSLMPLYRRYNSKMMPGYEKIFQPGASSWSYTHRVSVKASGAKLPKGSVVHHINFKKRDNRPENLEVMSRAEHRHLHAIVLNLWHKDEEKQKAATAKMVATLWTDFNRKKFGEESRERWNNPEIRQRIIDGIREHWSDEEAAAEHRESLRQANSSASHKDNVARAVTEIWKNSPERKKKTSKDCSARFKLLWQDPEFQEKMRIRRHGSGMSGKNHSAETRAKISKSKRRNHKVVSIEYVGKQDVYDITVDGFHNFALTSGVFVHNSAGSINRLNRNHITTDKLSLKAEDYGLLLTTLYAGAIDIPKFDALTNPKFGELFHLNIDVVSGKVDHEEGFHNDLTEALCGVVTMLKGIRKNVDDVASDMGNVAGNLATVSNNIWSDGPTEALEVSDQDDDDFSGGFINTRLP